MPSNCDVWTRVVLPIATFILGAVVTYLIQRNLRRRDSIAKSVEALADLTADWYNQLDDLRRSLDEEPTRTAELIDNYVRSRLILPKMLYHLIVLQERNAHPRLVFQVEKFLRLVTSYGEPGPPGCSYIFEGLLSDPPARTAFQSTLRTLDECQQAVAREAARAER